MKRFQVTLRWLLGTLALMIFLIAAWYRYPHAELRPIAASAATDQHLAVAILYIAQPSADHAEVNTTDKTLDSKQTIVDVFAVRTWEPPKPVVARPMPPPPPQAPPLPFRFLGRIADPDKGTAFLLIHGEQILSVGVGDRIDDIYRVDKLEGGQLYFLYQPLKIRQSLAVGSDL